MGMGRVAERTDDVGSTMIQSAAHCEYRQAAGAFAEAVIRSVELIVPTTLISPLIYRPHFNNFV
jgi:hypothetical protein